MAVFIFTGERERAYSFQVNAYLTDMQQFKVNQMHYSLYCEPSLSLWYEIHFHF